MLVAIIVTTPVPNEVVSLTENVRPNKARHHADSLSSPLVALVSWSPYEGHNPLTYYAILTTSFRTCQTHIIVRRSSWP